MADRCLLAILAIVALGATPASAATAKKTARKPAPKVATPVPAAEVAPATTGGFMVPKAVMLRSPTPADAQANAVWNIRAALNVAALQCQFSPYLATVKNYNDFLKHHADELVSAQMVLLGHFKRQDGARGPNSFDQYTTRTYNSYSTLDAQYKFCDAAGRVGREVLAVPKGRLGAEALRRGAEIRASLAQQPLSPALAVSTASPLQIDPIIIPDS